MDHNGYQLSAVNRSYCTIYQEEEKHSDWYIPISIFNFPGVTGEVDILQTHHFLMINFKKITISQNNVH